MQPLGLQELLEMVSGDVVSKKRYQGIVELLLAGPDGTWRPVTELDSTGALAEACRLHSPELGPKVMEGLRLAWTPNPDAPTDNAFCAVLFFYGRDDLMWHSLALFNRATL
jgi:hypothetical protein